MTKEPLISVVVIFHRMSRQAQNTLYSLSTRFQRNVSEEQYEILAIENSSDDVMGEAAALAQGRNIRYWYRDEKSQTPVPALNFGAEQARGKVLCLIIDGARMVSPGVLHYASLALRVAKHPIVVVPGYHLGYQEQHHHLSAGYDVHVEQELLDSVDWKRNGYRLFDISVFSGANERGYLGTFLESNCLFCTREAFERIGRADERFTLPGGGSVNIWMYGELSRLPDTRLVVLGGEGSFHQFHGGVTTSQVDGRDAVIRSHQENLRAIFGGPFWVAHRRPTMLGPVKPPALRFLHESAEYARKAFMFCERSGMEQWPWD